MEKAYQASIEDGALVKSIDAVFMRTTDYSPELYGWAICSAFVLS